MNRNALKLSLALISGMVALGVASVDAKRMGGGKTSGTKREAATQRQSTPPAATPAQNTAAPASAAAPAAAAKPAAAAPATPATPPKSGLSKWMPMLGGLALGAALASMFGGGALGSFIANALMILAVVMVGLLIWRFIAARRAGANGGSMTPAFAGAGAGAAAGAAAAGMQRTSNENALGGFGGNAARAPEVAQPAVTAEPVAAATEWKANVPAGFDSAGFEKGAKAQFIRLQGAFDKGEASTLKDMLTDEMYGEVDRELKARGANAHATEIVTLNSEIIEVTSEADGHWASVRFHGLLREDGNTNAENFDEIWNLFKPIDNSAGWLLAGIQQV